MVFNNWNPNKEKKETLSKHGVNLVIYANQLIRAAYPSMLQVAEQILENDRTFEVEDKILKISEILKLIPGTEWWLILKIFSSNLKKIISYHMWVFLIHF